MKGQSNSNANSSGAQPQSPAGQSSAANSSSDAAVLPVAEDMQPLEPVAPIDMSDMKQPLVPFVYLASATREAVPAATVAQTTTAVTPPIQATEEGWRLFGMAWYWWLLIGGAIGYGTRYFMALRRQKFLLRT